MFKIGDKVYRNATIIDKIFIGTIINITGSGEFADYFIKWENWNFNAPLKMFQFYAIMDGNDILKELVNA